MHRNYKTVVYALLLLMHHYCCFFGGGVGILVPLVYDESVVEQIRVVSYCFMIIIFNIFVLLFLTK